VSQSKGYHFTTKNGYNSEKVIKILSGESVAVAAGKKTGCRRRNVIKEDLVAEEDEVPRGLGGGSELHVWACRSRPPGGRMGKKRPAQEKRLKWCRRRSGVKTCQLGLIFRV